MNDIYPLLTYNPKRSVLDRIITVILVVLTVFVVALLGLRITFKCYTVEQTSMTPTFLDGDSVFVNVFDKAARGDVVIVNRGAQAPVIKRLIAKSGDRVKIIQGVVYVNDAIVKEEYVVLKKYEDFDEVTVPDGKIFVMGDNRASSYDSRETSFGENGFLKEKDIVGVVPTWCVKNVHKKKYKIFVKIYNMEFLRKIFGLS